MSRARPRPLAPLVLSAGLGLALALLAGVAAAGLWPHVPTAEALRRFPSEYLARSRDYHRVTYSLFALRSALALAVLAWLCFSGRAERWGERCLARTGGRAWLGAGLLALQAALLLALVDLPFAWFRGYHWDHVFGLSTRSAAGWWWDYGVGTAVGALVQAVAVAVLFAVAARSPRRWWLPAGALAALGVWLLTALGPVVVDPLFYRFAPLPPSQFRSELVTMAGRAGVPVREVLVADASRRTTAVNAYVAGSGPTRRIVLYDTLLSRYPMDEVELVVAHEIGHVAERHIEKGLAVGMPAAALAVGGLFLLMRGLAASGRTRGLPHPGAAAWVLLASAVATTLAMPVQNTISRSFEAEADAVSFRLAPRPEAAMRLERDLAVTNLADPDPNAYLEWVLFDHPPQLARLVAAERAVSEGEP